MAAIAHHHHRSGHESPTGQELVRATLSGIRRDYAAVGDRPRIPAAALLTADIVTIVAAARNTVDGWADAVLERRDSALILMGFAGAFRRSELVGLDCTDVTVHRHDGVHVRLRRSKTDQEGTGTVRALPFTDRHDSCPPCAYVRWAQVVAAFDTHGRPGVIRLLTTAAPFDAHSAGERSHAPQRGCRCSGRSARTATCPRPPCPGRRCTRRFAAAPNQPATTPPW